MEKGERKRNRKCVGGGGGVGRTTKEGRQWNYGSGRGGEKTIELRRGDGGKEQNCAKYALSSVT